MICSLNSINPKPVDPEKPEEPSETDTSVVDRLNIIRDSLDRLTNAVESLPTKNPALIEELNSIWAEYYRLLESGDTTDAESDSTDEDPEEDDGLPPTGETNNLMFALLGFVFIGSGVALALTFKKKEQTD